MTWGVNRLPNHARAMVPFLLSLALLALGGLAAGSGAAPRRLTCYSTQYGKTSVMCAGLNDSMRVLIWTNVAGSATCGGSGPGQNGEINYQGAAKSEDGRQVKWNCRTQGGKNGQVTLNKKPTLCRRGRSFL